MHKGLEELFRACYRDVYTYLFGLCHDGPLAEDLAQETFLEAVRGFAAFRGEADRKTWLFAIARHRWLDHLRRQKRRPPPVWAPDDDTADIADTAKTPEERAQTAEAARRAAELLAQQPPRTQQIVRLRMEGYSFYEIGLRCGLSENSARVIAFRAREKLRQQLQKEGLCDE